MHIIHGCRTFRLYKSYIIAINFPFTKMSFYLTLPSNSSFRYYPDNKVTNFFTKLPKPIQLDRSYEVALVGIIYPHTWSNVQDGENIITFTEGANLPAKCYLPPGHYNSPASIIRVMNRELQKIAKDKVEFKFHTFSRKVSVSMEEGCKISLGQRLSEQLGYARSSILQKSGYGQQAVNLNRSLPSLYVYCDLVEPQFVGDSLSPLLRIVNIQGKDGDIITKSYGNPRYLPLSKKYIDTVEIDIRDDTGEKVPFESGKVVATLHFRPAGTLYY